MNIPENLRYSKEHEWVRVEGTKAYVGITDFAQASLGDIVFVELPEVGKKIAALGEAGAVESVKAVSPVYSPVSGTVVEVNSDLEDAPESVNADPYGSWFFALEMANPADLDALLAPADYEKCCEQ